ncbi:MAG: proton-conducting membrane transporter [Alkaliphilus sp.]|nr:SLBB domain-containing protein [bacterium AH-315-K05]PHS34819.1 MAG: proton-conducting membrane transporter [Alkaliphilus sp.]
MNIVDKIYKAGVVGAGGAGFPTHIKLNCKAEYLIVNGAECEPLIKTDQYIMRTKSMEIIKAMESIGKHIEAEHLVLGLKKKYKKEIEILKESIAKLNSKVELHYLENVFPVGDEHILVYEVTNREVPPKGIPIDVGVVVANVGTVANVCKALEDRVETHKIVTVIGEVKNPMLLEVPIGTKVETCLEFAGEVIKESCNIIIGGPMMGEILDIEEGKKRSIKKTDGALIVIPKDHYLVDMGTMSMDKIINRAKSACIQCTFCTDLCPRYLIGHPMRPHKIMRSLGNITPDNDVFKEAVLCCECGICELYSCPMALSPRRVNAYIKKMLAKEKVDINKEDFITHIEANREFRQIPQTRLLARTNLRKYEKQKIGELKRIEVSEVSIALKQHIGEVAKSIVAVGDSVKKEQQIGRVDKNKLGANIHSSIDGIVVSVTNEIKIRNAVQGVIK